MMRHNIPKNICATTAKIEESLHEIRKELNYIEAMSINVRSMGERMEDALRRKNDRIEELEQTNEEMAIDLSELAEWRKEVMFAVKYCVDQTCEKCEKCLIERLLDSVEQGGK